MKWGKLKKKMANNDYERSDQSNEKENGWTDNQQWVYQEDK